ncbi:glycine betaine/L-proline ABC transporter, substrate-binding protein [Escherichia coli]|uniref:Glycine betaine/L-proline ABC transporter, substrate-binding protein n=1 Tax=Escherichia coli TaxID=562 RepID=A0A484YW83_ECOLX|nr:glycine betaine/L-proline ABC transporter, substrate-binding protein [Escherichia coli]
MRHSVLFATAFATLISTQTFAADLPGKGITVNPVQSTITEETFQTLPGQPRAGEIRLYRQ